MQNTKYEIIDGTIRKIKYVKKRSPNEMMLDILRLCHSNPTSITDIMHRGNFSWKTTMDYASILMSKRLLRQIKEKRYHLFQTTVEGKDAVFMWNKLRDILET